MKYNIFFYFNSNFRTFFSRIRIRIFPDRIRIFGRSGSGSGLRKKADPDPEKNPDPKLWFALQEIMLWIKSVIRYLAKKKQMSINVVSFLFDNKDLLNLFL